MAAVAPSNAGAPGPIIRRATVDDVPAMAKLYVGAFSDNPAYNQIFEGDEVRCWQTRGEHTPFHRMSSNVSNGTAGCYVRPKI